MRLITLYLPEPWIEAIDELVRKKQYPNRSETLRIAIHDFLKGDQKIRQVVSEMDREGFFDQ